jgi:hypothetical protein
MMLIRMTEHKHKVYLLHEFRSADQAEIASVTRELKQRETPMLLPLLITMTKITKCASIVASKIPTQLDLSA